MLRHRLAISVAAHLAFFALALLAAFALAYNFDRAFASGGDLPLRPPVAGSGTASWGWFAVLYLPLLAMVVPIKAGVFALTGQYRGSWRYVGLYDLFGVTWASLIGSVIFVVGYFLVENVSSRLGTAALIDRHDPPPAATIRLPAGFLCHHRLRLRRPHPRPVLL